MIWQEAVNSEFQSLPENNAWELEELPSGRKLVGSSVVGWNCRKLQGMISRKGIHSKEWKKL